MKDWPDLSFGFSPMDGFFLAVFLAVCILVAVLLRCLCYKFCLQSCTGKFRHGNDEAILPRHATPTITPVCRRTQERSPQRPNQSGGVPQIPPAGTVFTIYTFPQQQSPELQRSTRMSRPPKYSTVPSDSPPKYEDLFPVNSKTAAAAAFVSMPSTAFEMQLTSQPFTELQSIPEESNLSQAQSAASIYSTDETPVPSVSSSANLSSTSSRASVPNQVPPRVPKEDPPLYDSIYPPKAGE